MLALLPCVMTAQSNRRTINWSGYLAELETRPFFFSAEVENSHQFQPSAQDYFTLLTNAEMKMKPVAPGAGVSYWLLYTPDGMIVPEWRPHQQIRWEKEKGNFSFANRTRIENRFIRDTLGTILLKSYHFSLRPRILFQAEYSLKKNRATKNNLQFVVSEEIVAVFSKNEKGFTESRLYGGVWYTVNPRLSLRLGYLWYFDATNTINNADIVYFTLKLSAKTKNKSTSHEQ